MTHRAELRTELKTLVQHETVLSLSYLITISIHYKRHIYKYDTSIVSVYFPLKYYEHPTTLRTSGPLKNSVLLKNYLTTRAHPNLIKQTFSLAENKIVVQSEST